MKFMEKYPGIRAALNESGVSIQTLQGFLPVILAVYDELAVLLPDAMGWKTQKPAHARHCAEEAGEFAPILGFNEREQALFAVLFASHDLGRMIEGLRKCLKQDAPGNFHVTVTDEFRQRWPLIDHTDRAHGYDSAVLLKPILGAFGDTRIGRLVLLAVVHHSDVHNPTLEDMNGDRDALALTNMLRDLDKVEGFRQAKDYTSNPERKAKERLQNWSSQIQRDQSWGLEHRLIVSTDLVHPLVAFCVGQAIVRAKCLSYEAYMLQYLTWAKGIVEPCMLDVALAEGGPQIVAAYLLKQLEGSGDQYDYLFRHLQTWNDGVLLHAPAAR